MVVILEDSSIDPPPLGCLVGQSIKIPASPETEMRLDALSAWAGHIESPRSQICCANGCLTSTGQSVLVH
jgi:hypothetical protein